MYKIFAFWMLVINYSLMAAFLQLLINEIHAIIVSENHAVLFM